jgi:tetratricopeptide (TPR) repeat protein
MATPSKNPIERRFDRLYDQWNGFAGNDTARLLRWQLRDDEWVMVEGFLTRESDEELGQTADLFIRFSTAFTKPADHGFMLLRELYEQFGEVRNALKEEGQEVRWQPPQTRADDSDTLALVQGCVSLRAALGEKDGVIVALLEPERVADEDAYQLWLQRFVRQSPAEMRVIVLEPIERPAYQPLANAEPKRVVSQPAELDMPGALEELSANAGGLETPGGLLRHLFVQMNKALGDKDLIRGANLATQALAITVAQKWFHLAVPVHFILGSALMAAGRWDDAIGQYRAAELSAESGQSAEDPEIAGLCPALLLKARLGRGSALIAAKRYEQGAIHYQETVPVAQTAGDQNAVIDCWRLSAFCYEQDNQYKKAWDTGIKGLSGARDVDKEVLEKSTIAYLGEGMMRLSEQKELRGYGPRIEREMETLLGRKDWRPKAPNAPNTQAQGSKPA